MRKIILVRHGEPDFSIAKKISGHEIPSFLENYDKAPLKKHSKPSPKLQFLAQNSTIFCSDLPRSIESATFCGLTPDVIDPIFRESIPPHFQTKTLTLSPKTWLLLSRLLWLGGFSLHGESYQKASQRACKAAKILTSYAKERQVLLFGHGLFNILIAKALQSEGYCGKRVPAKRHWEFGIYHPFKNYPSSISTKECEWQTATCGR